MTAMFSIRLENDPVRFEGREVYQGFLTLNHHSERFYAPISYWTREKYTRQWREGLMRAISGQTGALVTALPNPEDAVFIEWWPIHPAGERFIFTNQILILNKIEEEFNENNIYKYATELSATAAGENPISKWEVSRESLENGLSQI
ncbi:hypothetical protein [Methylobrevis albus]|uniref:CdiI C-terminal domain-containing protein n=1 Tax=Methylobrevis albus TaxID=2793297 RepID=A0A931I1I3_9HYPH|nr:hypothetical protein [Methylobrevis albus]MBH0237558.1 hypothetical protein [Methylobrevis albus]